MDAPATKPDPDEKASAPRAIRSRRIARCDGCALPPAVCLCAEVVRVPTRTHVVLLVHPVELHKTTNTARLAALALPSSTLFVRGDGAHGADPGRTQRRLVLFPTPDARPLCEADRDAPEPFTLVVPDGSWPQARRIARRDPWAQGAEVVSLPDGAEGRYDLRRNQKIGGVCTFEAITRALVLLEGPHVEAELLRLLERFVERVHHVRALGSRYRVP